MREATHRLAFLAAFLAILVWGAACGGSTHDKQDGGADAPPPGSGGRVSTGGTTGTSARGGNVGSGGRATGGAGGGGAIGSGGASAVGGAGGAVGSGGATRIDGGVGTGGLSGSGGRATGGATGAGGGTGGAGGTDAGSSDGAIDRTDARADASPDGMVDGPPEVGADAAADLPLATDSVPEDGAGSGTIESCFVGLPAQVGVQMIATKSTADGRVRMRIALDTEDRMGTSGTYGWGPIRLAVEVDGVVTCITDRSLLRYTGSLHNCGDTATATAGTTKYSITAPDRPTATLTIEADGATLGPYTLTDTACTMFWSAGAPISCRSGGPC